MVGELGKKVQKRAHSKTSLDTPLSLPDFKVDTPVGSRKRRLRRGMLTVKDKIDICHRVLIAFEHHKDLAKQYRVSPFVVCCIVNKAKKNPAFLETLHEEEELKG